MSINKPPEPWLGFLSNLDENAAEPVDFHCLGGFVITVAYGLARSTSDVDVLAFVPKSEASRLVELGHKESELYKIHKVYLDSVTIVTPPEDYDLRLTEMFAGAFKRIRLFALDPYDIALTKIERNSAKDREDVKYLARTIPFDLNILRDRYEKELKGYLLVPERENLTMELWIKMIEEERGKVHENI